MEKAGTRGAAKGARVKPTSNGGTRVGVQLPTLAGEIFIRLRTYIRQAPKGKSPSRAKVQC